jgi:hypothetical protein
VAPGWRAILFRDDDFDGDQLQVTADVPNLELAAGDATRAASTIARAPFGSSGPLGTETLAIQPASSARRVPGVYVPTQRRIRPRGGNPMSNDATIANQRQILANQRKILANQRRLEANQRKLDRLLANQKKLDRILANQKAILSKLS